MEECLIEYVRLKPVLYDPREKDYRNAIVKKEAWDSIGDNLGISGNECKTVWTKLRNAYTQAIKRRTTKSGQAAKSLGKWKFEDQMAFIAPTLKPRLTYGNIEHTYADEYAMDNDNPFPDADGRPAESDAYTPPIPIISPPLDTTLTESTGNVGAQKLTRTLDSERNVKRSKMESGVSEVVVMRDNNRLRSQVLQSTLRNNKCYHDDLEMFFLSMAKSIKNLPKEEQVKIKMQVSQLVFQAELQFTQNSTQLVYNQFTYSQAGCSSDSISSGSNFKNSPSTSYHSNDDIPSFTNMN